MWSDPCTDTRCRHDEIRGLYIKQLARTWMEDSTMEAARATLDKNIDTAEEGLEHATEIVFALLHIANEDGAVESPAGDSSTVSWTKFVFYWVRR